MNKTISIGGDNLNPPMYHVDFEGNTIVGIDVYSSTLKCHFRLTQWTYDFHRYVKINKKEMQRIGKLLVDNKEDWSVLNNLHDELWSLWQKHIKDNFDEDGVLSLRNHKYGVIAYCCCPNVARSVKTVDYVNMMLGVFANSL